jgi:hypothetical protein
MPLSLSLRPRAHIYMCVCVCVNLVILLIHLIQKTKKDIKEGILDIFKKITVNSS